MIDFKIFFNNSCSFRYKTVLPRFIFVERDFQMKKLLILLLVLAAVSIPAESQWLDKMGKDAGKVINQKNINEVKKLIESKNAGSFTAEEAARAIKEALVNGTSKGTDIISKVDGFYKNPEIKIPFPKEAKNVESSLRKVGMGSQVDRAILTLNRAAEDASKSAKDIFVSAIQGMTISDAIKIVKGDTSAATSYLKGKTTAQLTKTFSPIIKTSLDKVDATKYWAEVMTAYNKLLFVQKVNPDLTKYVTQKALDALFLMISREEALIRKDPIARTSDLLKKVFGK